MTTFDPEQSQFGFNRSHEAYHRFEQVLLFVCVLCKVKGLVSPLKIFGLIGKDRIQA
jgi:hypothetical protein